MKTITLSLIDTDFAVKSRTAFQMSDHTDDSLMRFLNDICDELAVGNDASLEIEGASGDPITLCFSQPD